MKAHGLDVLVCRLPESVLLLTGYWPLSSFAWAVVPQEGQTCLIAGHLEAASVPNGMVDEVRSFISGMLRARDPFEMVQRELSEVLAHAGLSSARIGWEGSFESVATGHTGGEMLVPTARTRAIIEAAAPNASLVDATSALDVARACKTDREVEKLRLANKVAAFGLEAFRDLFEPGRTEAEVAAGVEAVIMSRGIGYSGARQVRSWTQLMTGPPSAQAYSLHPFTSDRKIQRGDLGVLELATVVDGFWSDLTRTLVAGGEPNDQQREMYEAVRAAHQATLTSARPGMTGGEIDALARAEIEQRGFGTLFVHQTGHGLGFRYHERQPALHPGNRDMIQAGMVSSVEPGLYLGDFGGMRLEDNVVFKEDGTELLSVFPADLGHMG